MLFGIEWDTSSNLAFAISIFPILMRGLWITLQATALGFAIALVLGLILNDGSCELAGNTFTSVIGSGTCANRSTTRRAPRTPCRTSRAAR